jgi:tetratricopeptide (TPR) repeat protein
MSEPQKKQSFFPNIFRFITERWKLIVVSLISVVILTGIVFQGLLLTQNLREFNRLQKTRANIAGELSYWEQIVREYEGYRDAYFRIASLHYQLGEIQEAKKSLEKVLSLDPNFKEAKVLGDKIESK